MSLEITTPEQYSELWKKESKHLESNGIYEKLASITPVGNVLEFGSGIGNGTKHLSVGRSVLSLDSNQYLIEIAEKILFDANTFAKIHKCDFFDLQEEDKKIISDFKPKIITGWFIGSNGIDIFKHTNEEPNPITKSKLYREKIEDIITSHDVCVKSVEYIHLVNRSGLVLGLPNSEYYNSTKQDYDTYVFEKIGFEVFDVQIFHWPREGSDFQYGQAFNPNLAKGTTIPAITSILARKK